MFKQAIRTSAGHKVQLDYITGQCKARLLIRTSPETVLSVLLSNRELAMLEKMCDCMEDLTDDQIRENKYSDLPPDPEDDE